MRNAVEGLGLNEVNVSTDWFRPNRHFAPTDGIYSFVNGVAAGDVT